MSTPDESITAEPLAPAAPAADEAPIPLPPPATPPVAKEDPGLRRRLARFDVVLAGLVLLLAFLLGSFAAMNSDLWMHLALGRDLLSGTYQFGVDPYAFTTEGVYWTNHSWLFDVLLYGMYSLFGGGFAVVVKALLVTLLAGLLASLRRADQAPWAALAVTALAVLVMSPRFVYQPVVLSYLFLAVTLFVLVRTSPADVRAESRISLWWLVPLFVLWANADHWFWLGPLTVGLFALGEWLQQRFPLRRDEAPPVPGRLKTLGLVCGAGLLACVLNPHHVRVFTLPPELAQLAAGLPLPADFVAEGLALTRLEEYDPQYWRGFSISPLQSAYFQAGTPGRTVAGVAYYPLLLLGLASFGLGLRVGVLRYWRLLLWLLPALLSLCQARLIPFFAVAAVPVTVLNLQDFATRWVGGEVRVPRAWAVGGRLLTALTLLALAALAWPGWLNPLGVASPYTARSPRRVAWRFEAEPSLKQAALALGELRQSGRLKNGFNYVGDIANYAVWLVPGYKAFYDHRYGLFADQAEAVGKIRRDFHEELRTFNPFRPAKEGAAWRRLFRERQINYVVLFTTDVNRTHALARRFYLDRNEWVLLYDNGRAAIIGWRGPRREESFAGLPKPLTRDARVAAFGPTPASGPPLRAEVNMPQRTWTPLDNWTDYAYGQPAMTLAFSEAVCHLQFFGDETGLGRDLFTLLFRRDPVESLWTSTAFLGPQAALGIGAGGGLYACSGLLSSFFGLAIGTPEDPGPAAHPLLAVRKARQSLAQDPNDAGTYVVLAQAYQTLADVEDAWRGQSRPLTEFSLMQLRSVQIMSALNFAIDLQPDHIEARYKLALLYARGHYFDAALEQLTEVRNLLEQRRAQMDQGDPKLFEQMSKDIEQKYKALSAEVNARRSSYLLRAERLTPNKKYEAALLERYLPPGAPPNQADPYGRGLPLEALKALRGADRGKLKEEHREQMDIALVSLLLRMGRFREMAEVPNSLHVLQETESSPRLLGMYQPAVGNYVEADLALQKIEQQLADSEKVLAKLAAEVVGDLLLLHQTRDSWLKQAIETFSQARQRILETRLTQMQLLLKSRAELGLLRGVLALEQGDTDKALTLLRDCVRLTGRGDTIQGRLGAQALFPDRRIAERLVRLLEAER